MESIKKGLKDIQMDNPAEGFVSIGQALCARLCNG